MTWRLLVGGAGPATEGLVANQQPYETEPHTAAARQAADDSSNKTAKHSAKRGGTPATSAAESGDSLMRRISARVRCSPQHPSAREAKPTASWPSNGIMAAVASIDELPDGGCWRGEFERWLLASKGQAVPLGRHSGPGGCWQAQRSGWLLVST